jgi:hypothetical protein
MVCTCAGERLRRAAEHQQAMPICGEYVMNNDSVWSAVSSWLHVPQYCVTAVMQGQFSTQYSIQLINHNPPLLWNARPVPKSCCAEHPLW